MTERIRSAAGRPETWLLMLLFWILASAARSWHTPWARVADTEALRWTAGIGLTVAIGLGLQHPTRGAKALLLGLGLLVCTVVSQGIRPDGMASGLYRDHQLCASALLALLPFAVAVALTARSRVWSWAAQAAVAAGLACLILTGARAAWAGALTGAAVFAWLWLRRRPVAGRPAARYCLLLLFAAAVTLGVAGILCLSGLNRPLVARMATAGHDGSWQWRWLAWQGALRMTAVHPWAGWGIGRYPAAHWRFAPLSHPLTPIQRPTLSDEAHEFYLQTVSEIGILGLALYLAALGAIARLALRTLARSARPRPSPRAQDGLLIAGLAVIAAQGVDALASPSWQFAEVSLLFWLGLGISLAAARRYGPTPDTPPIRWRSVHRFRQALPALSSAFAAVFVTAEILPVGLLSPAEAYDPPAGWVFSSLSISPAADVVILPTGYSTFARTVSYSMAAIYQSTDSDGNVTYSQPITFTSGPDCTYRDSSIFSVFTNNVLMISKADDPTIMGNSKTFTITGTLTDNEGPHSATTSLQVDNN